MKNTSQLNYILSFSSILFIACLLPGFSSSSPDGLEFVANKLHLTSNLSDTVIPIFSPFKDYQILGIDNPYFLNALIGFIGISICFTITFFVLKIVNSFSNLLKF